MSAYICNPEHFGALAAFAASFNAGNHRGNVVIYAYKDGFDLVGQAKSVARHLAIGNIESVKARYPDDPDGGRPGPGIKDAEVIAASELFAVEFMKKPPGLSAADIYKMARCYNYQSCEVPDYELSDVYRQINEIKDAAAESLPSYEAAFHSFFCPDAYPPSVKKFYKGLVPEEV